MTPDQFNALFEVVGACLTFHNAWRVRQDGGYAGVSPGVVAFFWSWGLWNIYFYPSLGQWWSFVGGLLINMANLVWIGAMWRYGRKR